MSWSGALAKLADVRRGDLPSISTRDYCKADGSDDTARLQAALTAAAGRTLWIFDEITTGPVYVPSNSVICFAPGARLKAKTGFGANDRLLCIHLVSNVVIFGNSAEIQMLKAEYVTGEHRHCVSIFGSANVAIYDLTAKDSGGDGFYIGGDPHAPSVNIHLVKCAGDNNRRQGLSIVNVRNCFIQGGEYKNTNGTSPARGIDIESNLLDGYYLENVNIIGVRTFNNSGGGILITPQSKFFPVSITVANCTSDYDGLGGGISINAAMAYTSGTAGGLIGKISGSVTVRDCAILNSQGTALQSGNWTENAPTTVLSNIYILNPASNPAVATIDQYKCGVLIRGELSGSGNYGSSVGHLSIDGLVIEDNRTVPLMLIPIYLNPSDEATKPLKNIRINGIVAIKSQWTSGSATPVIRSGSLASTNLEIGYDDPFVVESGSTTLSAAQIGATIVPVTSSNFTLPTAANFIGSEFTVRSDNTGNLQLTPQVADIISGYSPAAGVGLIARSPGALMTVRSVESGRWQVVRASGGWGVSTFYGQRFPLTANTAAPVAGTWVVGDVILNSTPTRGGFAGWVCTTGGTPGTWAPFGRTLGVSANKGDAGATLAVTSEPTSVWKTPLTTDRAVTLSTASAFNGARLRVVRTAAATGASNLNVGTGPLRALAAGQWCEVEYDGTAWFVSAAGSL